MNARLQGPVVVGLVLLSFGSGISSASTKALTVSGFGNYHRYDMPDVNQAMQEALAAFPGAQAEKDEIDQGVGFGLAFRIWSKERLFGSLEYQRLPASNSGSGPYAGSTYTVDLGVPANAFTLGFGYLLTPKSRFRFGLAGGVGFYVTTGEMVTTGPGVNETTDFEGSGFGGHGLGMVLTRIARKVDLELDAGYRYAKTSDITGGGYRIRNSDGSLAKIDWSGFTSSLGVTFWARER